MLQRRLTLLLANFVKKEKRSLRTLKCSYFPIVISIALTFAVPPSDVLSCSVLIRISLTPTCGINRFLKISAASTALLIARPLAFTITSLTRHTH